MDLDSIVGTTPSPMDLTSQGLVPGSTTPAPTSTAREDGTRQSHLTQRFSPWWIIAAVIALGTSLIGAAYRLTVRRIKSSPPPIGEDEAEATPMLSVLDVDMKEGEGIIYSTK